MNPKPIDLDELEYQVRESDDCADGIAFELDDVLAVIAECRKGRSREGICPKCGSLTQPHWHPVDRVVLPVWICAGICDREHVDYQCTCGYTWWELPKDAPRRAESED